MNELVDVLNVPTLHESKVGIFQDVVHYIRTNIARSMYLRKLLNDFQREIVDKLAKPKEG
jgi:hypothetical protein